LQAITSIYQSEPRLFRVYSYYRLVLSIVLLVTFSSSMTTGIIGNFNPQLFFLTGWAYLALNGLALLIITVKPYTPKIEQTFATFLLDLLFISLLSYASGGVDSGLNYLFFICLITASLFLHGQLLFALAALASIALLTIEFNLESSKLRNIFSAGTMGALLFATGGIFQSVSRRLKSSEQEVMAQAENAAYLEQLTNRIVARLYTGIVVVSENQQVLIINHSARQMLSPDEKLPQPPFALSKLDELQHWLNNWRELQDNRARLYTSAASQQELRLGFVNMGRDTLVFVDNNHQVERQAQQLKLASLGHLTASIAHEIRNPLGALSHANQLLQESEKLSSEDSKLTDIIDRHSKRVNRIIETVLQHSRRKKPNTELLSLNDWLVQMVENYRLEKNLAESAVVIQPYPDTLLAKFDPQQISQVLSNLFDNGLRYSKQQGKGEKILIRIKREDVSEQALIEVIDYGQGIDPQAVSKIFEPFFTTSNEGSGLGLYIAKELCDSNHIILSADIAEHGGSCFRLRFPHPEAMVQ